MNAQTLAALDAYVDHHRRRLLMPGVMLAVVAGGRLVHTRGFGHARPDGGPPTPQTPFYIGSVTKSLTALAVMQLVEAGKIELGASVQHYLPWFRVADAGAAARITVRHLLHHTSGLPGLAGEIALADFDACPGAAERQARALAAVRLAQPPGQAWKYSNANYNLLGLVIAAAVGLPYMDYLQRHVLAPLGMDHTTAPPPRGQPAGLAMGHQYWFGLPIPAANLPVPHGALASGQLISTAADLARYAIVLLDGGRCGDQQILSRAGVETLMRGAAEIQFLGRVFGHYSMGWCVVPLGRNRLVWHGGTLPHFGAFVGLLPERSTGLVLLFNACHHWMNPVLSDFGMGAAAVLTGQPPKPSPFRVFPWLLRAQALIPVAEAAGVAGTLRQLRAWRRQPVRRPSGAGAWARHVLLPLIPNLLLAFSLRPMLSQRRGYLKLFMPDFVLLAWVCGGFALLWSVVRTLWMIGALRERSEPIANEKALPT
jgi:CubicO group peptidase (beta-lactamase class C family)